MTALPADALFRRQWKVVLWNAPAPGILNPPPPLDVSALDIEFRILRTLKPSPNRATITLWNINQEHRAQLIQRTRPGDANSPNIPVNVQVEAGYQNQMTVLFSGDLREVSSRRENTDWRVTMSMDDGGQAVREARFPTQGGICFPKGTHVGTVLTQLCSYLGIGLGNAAQFDSTAALMNANSLYLPYKMTFKGAVYDELKRLCQSIGVNCSIQNGVLQLLAKGHALGGVDNAVVLGPDSGLVESPESAIDTTVSLGFAKEAKGVPATTPKTVREKKTSVVRCRSLLIPGLVPGRRVILNAAAPFNGGDYVITEVEYVGQSWGNEWYAVMVLRVYVDE